MVYRYMVNLVGEDGGGVGGTCYYGSDVGSTGPLLEEKPFTMQARRGMVAASMGKKSSSSGSRRSGGNGGLAAVRSGFLGKPSACFCCPGCMLLESKTFLRSLLGKGFKVNGKEAWQLQEKLLPFCSDFAGGAAVRMHGGQRDDGHLPVGTQHGPGAAHSPVVEVRLQIEEQW